MDDEMEQAIYYKFVKKGCYRNPDLSKDEKRAVRKRATPLELVNGKVFKERRNGRVEVVRSVEDKDQKISDCHSGPTGHLGVTKTQKAVADRFYWKGMADDVRKHIRACPDPDCRKRNTLERGSVECSEDASFLLSPVVVASSLDSIVQLRKRNGETPSGKPSAKIRRGQYECVTGNTRMPSIPTSDIGVSGSQPPTRNCDGLEDQSEAPVTANRFFTPGSVHDIHVDFFAPCNPPGSIHDVVTAQRVEHMPMECSEVSADLPEHLTLVHHPDEDELVDFARKSCPALSPPTSLKPWHESVYLEHRQKLVEKLYNARVKYLTAECVDMQDVVVEEEFLFSWAESKEQYDWHMKERIDTNGGNPLRNTKAKTYSVVPPCGPSLATSYTSPVPNPLPDLEEMQCGQPSVSSRVETSKMETESLADSVNMTVETFPETPPNSPYLCLPGLETESSCGATSSSSSHTEGLSSEFGASCDASGPCAQTPPTSPKPFTMRQTGADHSDRKTNTAKELELALGPVLKAVWNRDHESRFRQPVEPKSMRKPIYPMDLGTMRGKLEKGEYKNPWEFCRDMWLMFDNAWLYNKKTSRVYKYCSKLSEVFDQYIDDAMKSLGYCCGRRFTFHPQVLYCYGKPLCTIPRDTCYYGHKNRFGKYVYCRKCFFEIPGDSISVGDDPMTATSIPKNAFEKLKNDSIDYEEMVECIYCGREVHKICVLHHDLIWPDGYQCKKCLKCLKAKGTVRKENQFTAKGLPTTKLSSVLEERVNTFLRMQDADAGEITVRVVSSSDKTLDTRTNMRERFAGEFPEQFPYRAKAMFVFEEIDGNDVCFFGMHVQEYGSDCQAPNTRRVYISYLDSVHFFRPRHLRTQVYHELLIGYLQFCKDNGFLTAHIWACPPIVGDDYIFHCHPAEQKIPKPKRLVEWYKKMLDTAKAQGVILDYKDIIQHCTDEGINSVTEIPYFEGDFWLNVIEETIKELDQEARERKASEQAAGKGRHPKKAGSTRSKSRRIDPRARIGGDDVSQKIFQAIHKDKEVCFVITLQPPAAAVSSPLPGTTDPDQLIQCDVMDERDAFLTMARERHWEFSSLRRARYSTMAMLYELHNQSGDRFVYTCNHCCDHVETRYHCKECDDFDLCVVCYKEVGHSHTMEKLGLGLDDDTTGQDQRVTDPKDQQMQRRRQNERFMQQRMANMNQLSASNNGSNSQHTPSPPVAHTSPPGGSKNPTPPCKGSPAPAKAVSNPAAVAASPIAPSSVGHDVLSVIRDIMPHQPGSYGQPLPPSAISQVQPQPHTMMMQNRPQQPMMYHSQQVAPPQQTMMRPTMVQQHPAYHGAGGQQMPPHTLRPPPQYPSAHGPQTAGYPQVLGQQPRPMPSHSPMAQHMLAPTLHQPSLQSTMVVPPLASKYHRSTECSDEPIFCAQPYLGDYHHQLCTGTQTAEQLLFLSQPHSSAHIEHGL